MVAVPARHPVLAYKRIPLDEVLRYPLVLCDPQHAKAMLAKLIASCADRNGSRLSRSMWRRST